MEKPRTRAMIVTALVMAAVCLLLPSIMAVIAEWNENVANTEGRNFTLNAESKLMTTDIQGDDENDGMAVHAYQDTAGDTIIEPIDVAFVEPTSIDGYVTIDPIDAPAFNESASFYGVSFVLNMTLRNLIENDSTGFVIETRGLEEGCSIAAEVHVLNALACNNTYHIWAGSTAFKDNTTEAMDSAAVAGDFTRMEIPISIYDMLYKEDLAPTNQIQIILYFGLTGYFNESIDGTFLDLRIYAECPISAMHVAQEDAIQFSYGTVGIVLLVFGIFATPFVNVMPDVGVRTEFKRKVRDNFRRKGGGYQGRR